MRTRDGVYGVDLETEDLLGLEPGVDVPLPGRGEVALPLVVASAASGSTVVAVLERRPPLAVSHDAGVTWHEAGGGLPAGRAVAVSPDDPDLVLYAGRNRLFLSRDGARFWSGLALELPEIEAVAFATP
ncbi:MAG: hypothetical protein H0T39_13630 [Actinobacteria bacterium]|nr:hypothetical protein [Actinomycetota bacterium]